MPDQTVGGRRVAAEDPEKQQPRSYYLSQLDDLVEQLERLAQSGGYPVRWDHCFKRIAFDAAVKDQWDRVVGRPFYKNASTDTLRGAVQALREIREPDRCKEFNRKSLKWRGKL